MSETKTFLLEIGTEEIPASYLEPAAEALANSLKDALFGLGIDIDGFVKMWTPRRITLIIKNLATTNPEHPVELFGPPMKIAKDKAGNWTQAAIKFAEKSGCKKSDLFPRENEKGNYAAVKVKSGGDKTEHLLSQILPTIILKLPFPRRMRWTKLKTLSFARPVRWLCCLFGEDVIEFTFPDLVPSAQTYGHRFAYPEAITVNQPDEYVAKLRDQGSVLVDPNARKKEISRQLTRDAKKLGGSLVANPELADEVVNLVEYPNVLSCSLGGFTDLPREVLETALAKHQRAFVVEKKGKLMPHFLVVTNSPGLDPELSREWFERMAVSRLEDADFFIKEDLEKGLEALVEEEFRVVWIKGVGTLADKTRFLTKLGLEIGGGVDKFNPDTYRRTAHLAKADLLTNLVREKEFTSLQGIAGAIYAERLGEKPEVCTAIGQQYTDSPTSPESAVLAIADRLLNICATFVIGKPPKGSSDPFALRRQAGTVFKILADHRIHLDLPAVISRILELFGKKEKEEGHIAGFLRDRLELFFKDREFAYDWVNAVIAVSGDDPYDSFLRLTAFSELHKAEEFKLVAVGQKRVANITRNTPNAPPPDTSLFEQLEEKALWEEAERIRPAVLSAVSTRKYKKALELLLSIRPAIDRFFDEVFVMVEDEKIKNNRLHLLNAVKHEFLKVADFSRIVVE